MLEDAETERDDLKSYIDAFHNADKRAAVLAEQLLRNRSVEVFFGVGISLGGAIMGLSPFFWELDRSYGATCLILGFLIVVGAAVGRAVKR